jgi:ABC-type lipoprotein release transport system permease subunit
MSFTVSRRTREIGAICAIACIVPAGRALGIQPTEALREEG